MYSDTVTIFNYYESSTAAVWYPHILSGVHLETDRGQIMKKYGPDSTDKAELHIAYTEKDRQKVIGVIFNAHDVARGRLVFTFFEGLHPSF